MAEPGGICVSARVQEDAAGKLADLAFADLGERQLQALIQDVNANPKTNAKAQEATARLQALRVLRPGERVVGVRDGKIYAMLSGSR